jgi:hypothetical protein
MLGDFLIVEPEGAHCQHLLISGETVVAIEIGRLRGA